MAIKDSPEDQIPLNLAPAVPLENDTAAVVFNGRIGGKCIRVVAEYGIALARDRIRRLMLLQASIRLGLRQPSESLCASSSGPATERAVCQLSYLRDTAAASSAAPGELTGRVQER